MRGNKTTTIRLIVSNECRLSGAPEPLLAAIRQLLTIDNPKYQDAKRYSRWIGKRLQPKLFFFREEEGVLFFPRGFINQVIALCRQLTGDKPHIIDQRRLLDALDLHFTGALRPYQAEAVNAVVARSFGVLEAGTGSGKTIMALKAIAERKQPTIIVVHSKELLYQWRDRITEFLGIEAGQVGDGSFELRPLTVAIVNSARKHIAELPAHFGQIIVDECHRVPASLFTDVVSCFDSHYMLGLSATAFRREDGTTRLIYIYMGDRIHRVDITLLTRNGAVLLPDIIQQETSFTYGFRGEYAKLINALVKDEKRNEQICHDVGQLVSKGHEGTILLVSDRIAHCEILAGKLLGRGIENVLLTGQTATEQRCRIVQDVQSGEIRVLISTLQLIGEGFDCPGLTTLVLATPIKFAGRLLQVVGRIMRPADGKKAQVIDYVDINVPLLRKSAEARLRILHNLRE